MLEIFQTEKKSLTETLEIRAHHLYMWRRILPVYYKFSDDKKPWEIPFEKVIQFAEKYAIRDTDRDIAMRNFFETYSVDDPEEKIHLRYSIDLVGTDVFPSKVLKGRTEYFKSVFGAAARNKNSRIFLTTEPDGYCKACAIGRHCRRTSIQKILKFNHDYEAYHYLTLILKDKNTGDVICGKLSKNKDGFFISAELLFDPVFHQFLENEENNATFPWNWENAYPRNK
jgi:hypothetical protein